MASNDAQLWGYMCEDIWPRRNHTHNDAQLKGQWVGGVDSTWPATLAARLGAVRVGIEEGEGEDGDHKVWYGEDRKDIEGGGEAGNHVCSNRSFVGMGSDRIRPLPIRSTLLLRAACDVLLELPLAIVRDSRSDDPRSILCGQFARMRLAKVVAQYLRIDADLGRQFLRSIRFRVRHVLTSNRSFVCVGTAYHGRTHMCCKHSVNVRTHLPIVRTFDRSFGQAFVRALPSQTTVVRCQHRRHATHPCRRAKEESTWKIFRAERSEKDLLFLAYTNAT